MFVMVAMAVMVALAVVVVVVVVVVALAVVVIVVLVWFLTSSFHYVLNVVCFFLGKSSASKCYTPTFRNILLVPSS